MDGGSSVGCIELDVGNWMLEFRIQMAIISNLEPPTANFQSIEA